MFKLHRTVPDFEVVTKENLTEYLNNDEQQGPTDSDIVAFDEVREYGRRCRSQ